EGRDLAVERVRNLPGRERPAAANALFQPLETELFVVAVGRLRETVRVDAEKVPLVKRRRFLPPRASGQETERDPRRGKTIDPASAPGDQRRIVSRRNVPDEIASRLEQPEEERQELVRGRKPLQVAVDARHEVDDRRGRLVREEGEETRIARREVENPTIARLLVGDREHPEPPPGNRDRDRQAFGAVGKLNAGGRHARRVVVDHGLALRKLPRPEGVRRQQIAAHAPDERTGAALPENDESSLSRV